MKHVLNILILFALVGFAIVIAYMTRTSIDSETRNNAWPTLYFPLVILMILFGIKINKDY